MVLGPPPLAEGGVGESGCDVIPGLTHDFEITSPFSRTDAMAAIARHIEPIKWFRLQIRIGFWTVHGDRGADQFEGEMTPDGFIAQRIMGYQNLCPPRLRGLIMTAGRGSVVTVQMTPTAFGYTFPALLALVILATAMDALPVAGVTAPNMPVVFAVFAVMTAIWFIAFWFEALRQETTLRIIFKERG